MCHTEQGKGLRLLSEGGLPGGAGDRGQPLAPAVLLLLMGALVGGRGLVRHLGENKELSKMKHLLSSGRYIP